MAVQDKNEFVSGVDSNFPDNQTQEITALDFRDTYGNVADSFPMILENTVISGKHTFQNNITIPETPIEDTDAVSFKYFQDNASPTTGDVTGGTTSTNNELVLYNGTTGKVIQNGSNIVATASGGLNNLGNLSFNTATNTIFNIQVGNLLDRTVNASISAASWTFDNPLNVATPTLDSHAVTLEYFNDNVPDAGGDVVGPVTATNNGLVIYDGTTGKLIKSDANLTWNGSALSVGGDINVTGSFNPTSISTATLDVSGNATIGGTLGLTGDLTGAGATFSGAVTITKGAENLVLRAGSALGNNYIRFKSQDGTVNKGFIGYGSAGSNDTLSLANSISGEDMSFLTSATTRLTIDGTSGDATFNQGVNILGLTALSGSLVFKTTSSLIRNDTSDNSDDRRLLLTGAGSTGSTRGGYITLNGNEYASSGGGIQLIAGNVATGDIILNTGGSATLTLNQAGNATFSGDVTASGHISYQCKIQDKSADYTLVASDNNSIIRLTGSTARTFTLPTTGISSGYTVQIVNESTANLTLTSAATINSIGSASPVITEQFTGVTAYWDGSDWVVIGSVS